MTGPLDRVPALWYVRADDVAWTLHEVGGALAVELGLEPGSSLLAQILPEDRPRAEREAVGKDAHAARYRLARDRRWVLDRGRRELDRRVGLVVELPEEDAVGAERRSELEARLWEAQKLEAVGRLAGGVAHEFNNLLTGILGNAAILRGELGDAGTTAPEGSPAAVLARIEEAATRAAQRTQQLLAFARKGKAQEVVFDLQAIVDDAVALLRASVERSVQLVVSGGGVAAPVLGDPAQIEELLLNLGWNARDALGGQGTIRFGLERVEEAPRAGLEAGPYAVLSVEDDGPGVPEHLRRLVFEPFFSTKPRGTGMGLAMSYGVAQSHGGLLVLDDARIGGARFLVYLPIARARRAADSSEPPAPTRRSRVLLVDDEEFVRYAVRAQLEALGHEVLLAKDGAEALTVYADARPELVILDLTMPRMSGRDCFLELKRRDPSVRAILSSGFGRDASIDALLAEGLRGFLEKPFRQAELAAEIARALDADSA